MDTTRLSWLAGASRPIGDEGEGPGEDERGLGVYDLASFTRTV